MLNEAGRILKEDELVTKKDIELLQLKSFYEQKYSRSLKVDILRGLKKWFYNHFRVILLVTLFTLCIVMISFYLGIKTNNTLFFIPVGLGFLWIMFVGIVLEPTKSNDYLRNLDTINLILKSRKELSLSDKPQQEISQKMMLVYDCLKLNKELNLTRLREELHKSGKKLDYKTIRKHLKILIDNNIVSIKEKEYESSKRKQDSAKVYSIK